ncbi:Resolvase domain protein [Cellulomonas flavigena DSM 20109]|uniref:Resolvase domain protein n=1 Tax=Cellulomonas flavigena (strain ATCC 482 / DSM 20109 / BCRC 11376 / JCM 18109 / NBRC 3775 / NCIMB 8073 / NRS 134) TaxID=446466 RepID=D5UBP0_CELFN|nr:recombinase family protein [Cellulomonas flavigena]ADG74135.1 Resolvase domain protein [Cellulomonas flavigena DSM 20109]
MTKRTAVAVYARISQDRSGEELGVRRQLADCRAEAARRGWTVAEEYIDDDSSAYSGKVRPSYDRMLADLAEGRRDAVVVWHMDRLHRRPIEFERFVEVCTRAGVQDVVTLSGDVDLAKGDGLLVARVVAAFAASESDAKRRRGRRKALEIAESGRPMMGGPRPFGFLDDRVTHHPAEAPVVRELAARALAGETLISLSTWLQDSGVRTVGGNEWRTTTVRQLLTNPRAWGMRVHQGQVIGKATWEPIITPEDGERLRRLLLDPARRTNRSARRYLLTGMLRCGKCGSPLRSAPKDGKRRYGCAMGPDHRGCGGVFIYAEMLERFVTEAVLYRLDSPVMDEVLTGDGDNDERARALGEAIKADTDQLDDLATMWADGEVSKAEWLKARGRIESRLEASRAEFYRVTHRDAVAPYLGRGDELRAQWDGLAFSRQVAIVKAVLAQATILPAAVPGRHGLDPERVEPEWRL